MVLRYAVCLSDGSQDPVYAVCAAGRLEDTVATLSATNGDRRMRMTLAQILFVETQSKGLVLVFVEPPESASDLPVMLVDQFIRDRETRYHKTPGTDP